MADTPFSTKRVQISKANTTMVVAVAVASFIVVTSLMFSKALMSQRAYQSRVIKAQKEALNQLKENIGNVDSLKSQYQAFVDQPENIIGGSSTGTGERDGDNARIVLDALPSKYDFPALATSLEKLLATGLTVSAISGSDDEIAQSQNTETKPVEVPYTIAVAGTYPAVQNFIGTLDKSIRPMHLKTLTLAGEDDKLTASITAVTYYQPAKTLNIETKEVK
jgi:Tfp pilus assembly protein PilO